MNKKPVWKQSTGDRDIYLCERCGEAWRRLYPAVTGAKVCKRCRATLATERLAALKVARRGAA